jgi:hypothetical protein
MLRVNWEELEVQHKNFKERLRGLGWEKRESNQLYEDLIKRRKKLKQKVKVDEKILRKTIREIGKIGKLIKQYRETWLQRPGGTEANFFLHLKANEAMYQFKLLSEKRKAIDMDELKLNKVEARHLDKQCTNALRRYKDLKSQYQNMQRQMDQLAIMKVVTAHVEEPSMDVNEFVKVQVAQLSIKKRRAYKTNRIEMYKRKGDKWYHCDRKEKPTTQCTSIEAREVEKLINKHTR